MNDRTVEMTADDDKNREVWLDGRVGRAELRGAYTAGWDALCSTYWDHPYWNEGYKQGEENGYEAGQKKGEANKAEAVQAEHEATLAGMDALYRVWKREHAGWGGFSFEYVRDRMEEKYVARTNPKKVTVRMSQKDYEIALRACGVLELVDPPGESKESSCA